MPEPSTAPTPTGPDSVATNRLAPERQRFFQSLPTRIVAAVFGAALLTSAIVTWTSTQSIESFLRQKIDQKLPDILVTTGTRLDLWYAQRQIDINTFAHSSTLVSNVGRLASGDRGAARAKAEVHEYLSYVLDRFPQFGALVLLDEHGERVLGVGLEKRLPSELRSQLAEFRSSRIGDIRDISSGRAQIASAPVRDDRDRLVASLHAVIGISTIEQILHSSDLGESISLYVVGRDGETLLASPTARRSGRRVMPELAAAGGTVDHVYDDGEHVVMSSAAFDRFGWTLTVEETYDEAFAPVGALIRRIMAVNTGVVLLFSLVALVIARSIVKPVMALSATALRIAAGEENVELPRSQRADEIGTLSRALYDMVFRLDRNQAELTEQRVEIERTNEKLVAKNLELRRMNEVFEQLAITDGLTKLHNHRFFQEHLQREINLAERTGAPLALLLIDIDHFKEFNDRFGHSAGDEVLRQVATAMNRVVRETDLLARYGGEEFALLSSHQTLEGAGVLAEKVRLVVADTVFSVDEEGREEPVSITISIGVADFRGDRKRFFADADRALYRAKDAGRDCVVVAGESEDVRDS